MAISLNAVFHVLEKGNEIVTSPFGYREITVNGKTVKSGHKGIDLINNKGKDIGVLAFDDGEIFSICNSYKGRTNDGSAGNYIIMHHNNGYTTVYYHLKHNSIKVKIGQKIKQGQKIATMGDTGYCTGTHLHFGIQKDNKWVDPAPFLKGEKQFVDTIMGNSGNKPKIKWPNSYDRDCKELMDMLNKKYKAKILADGIPGNRTYNTVKKYKVKAYTDYDLAEWVQKRLTTMGLYKGLIDGEPRTLTANAIGKFQEKYGIKVTKEVSGTTWYYLLAWRN